MKKRKRLERINAMMDTLEKVERLRERANVSYEEAKLALEQTNGDLLDAIVLLERQGKTKKPEQASYSTSYDEQERYDNVKDKVAQQQSRSQIGITFGQILRKVFHILRHNSLCVTRKDSVLFVLPVWAFVLILLLAWRIVLPVMIISLFFWVRYSFTGEDDLSKANAFMDKVGNIADDVKEEFRK